MPLVSPLARSASIVFTVCVLSGIAVAAPPLAGSSVSPGWLARAKANGLDPADPSLAGKMTALSAKRRTAILAAHTPVPIDVKSAGLRSKLVYLDAGTAAGIRSLGDKGTLPGSSLPGPKGKTPTPAPVPKPSIASAKVEKDSDGFPTLDIAGDHFKVASTATDIFADTSCGMIDIQSDTIDPFRNDKLTTSAYLPIDHSQNVKMDVRVGAVYSNKIDVPIAVEPGCFFLNCLPAEIIVGDDSSMTQCSEVIPCTASKSAFLSKSQRSSTNPTDKKVEGDDVLGYGIQSVNGFSFGAKIEAVWSLNDPPGSSDPNNEFRGATITQTPADGRIETKIHWYHEGGESIGYAVWFQTSASSTANGYFRQTTAYPKQSRCPSET